MSFKDARKGSPKVVDRLGYMKDRGDIAFGACYGKVITPPSTNSDCKVGANGGPRAILRDQGQPDCKVGLSQLRLLHSGTFIVSQFQGGRDCKVSLPGL